VAAVYYGTCALEAHQMTGHVHETTRDLSVGHMRWAKEFFICAKRRLNADRMMWWSRVLIY
jgi:hypothetical protein